MRECKDSRAISMGVLVDTGAHDVQEGGNEIIGSANLRLISVFSGKCYLSQTNE